MKLQELFDESEAASFRIQFNLRTVNGVPYSRPQRRRSSLWHEHSSLDRIQPDFGALSLLVTIRQVLELWLVRPA
jgi:hypothetical protein